MFYLPFKFRQQNQYCTPKGPNFKFAQRIQFSINGNTISLRAPRHRAGKYFPSRRVRNARSQYQISDTPIDPVIHIEENDWGWTSVITRAWDFYGPWFTGQLGRVELYAYITHSKKIPENTSYFHPRAFENAIANYLTHSYGDRLFQGRQDWFAPVDWQPAPGFPCVAATFTAQPNKKTTYADNTYYLVFPITEHHLMVFSLSIERGRVYIGSEPQGDVDNWINRAPLDQLARDIIHSVSLSLSPETEELQRKALAGLSEEEAALSKTFLPLKWGEAPLPEELRYQKK